MPDRPGATIVSLGLHSDGSVMGTLAVIRQLRLLQFVRDLMSDGQDYILATLWSLGQEAIQFHDDSARFGLLLGTFQPAYGVACLSVAIGPSSQQRITWKATCLTVDVSACFILAPSF